MVALYRLVGFLYLMSGLWCIFQLELSSGFLGFELLTAVGRSEFFSVYGGLQIGLGMAIMLSSFREDYLEACVYFSAIFSVCLALFRIVSFVIYGLVEGFMLMLVLEVFIGLSLCLIWLKLKQTSMHQS